MKTYGSVTLRNELNTERVIFFAPKCNRVNVDEEVDFWTDKGWSVFERTNFSSMTDFLKHWFAEIRRRATNKTENFSCSNVRVWGQWCYELIDIMMTEDVDWSDLDMDGELFIHLSIVYQQNNYCILMEDK